MRVSCRVWPVFGVPSYLEGDNPSINGVTSATISSSNSILVCRQ